jgi:hypothetical protein
MKELQSVDRLHRRDFHEALPLLYGNVQKLQGTANTNSI